MNRILVIAEHDGKRLNLATAKCLRCAQQINGEITIAVLGSGVDGIAQAAAQLEGVTQVLTFDSAANAHPLAAVFAPQLAAMAGEVMAEGLTKLFPILAGSR